jgi:hypothetical protein
MTNFDGNIVESSHSVSGGEFFSQEKPGGKLKEDN